MNKYISGAIAVEVPLSAGQIVFNFPDVPLLREKRIKHIEQVFIAKSYSGKDIYSSAVYLNLTEVNTQSEMVQNLNTNQLNVDGNRLYLNKMIDLQRSYISIPTGGEANKVVLFVFWFDEPVNRAFVEETNNRTVISHLELKLTGSRTYFPENFKLRGKRIQQIYLQFPEISPNGNDGITSVVAENKFITLSRNNVEFFKNIPISIFYQSDKTFELRIQNIQFDFQNSYIDTLTTTADDLKTVFFNLIIDDNKQTRR